MIGFSGTLWFGGGRIVFRGQTLWIQEEIILKGVYVYVYIDGKASFSL